MVVYHGPSYLSAIALTSPPYQILIPPPPPPFTPIALPPAPLVALAGVDGHLLATRGGEGGDERAAAAPQPGDRILLQPTQPAQGSKKVSAKD
jgi:hypothetical protein